MKNWRKWEKNDENRLNEMDRIQLKAKLPRINNSDSRQTKVVEDAEEREREDGIGRTKWMDLDKKFEWKRWENQLNWRESIVIWWRISSGTRPFSISQYISRCRCERACMSVANIWNGSTLIYLLNTWFERTIYDDIAQRVILLVTDARLMLFSSFYQYIDGVLYCFCIHTANDVKLKKLWIFYQKNALTCHLRNAKIRHWSGLQLMTWWIKYFYKYFRPQW